jgi:hypothetical protein
MPENQNTEGGLRGTESEFAKALLAIAEKLTAVGTASGPTLFPHGIGSIDLSATIEVQKITFSLKIVDAATKLQTLSSLNSTGILPSDTTPDSIATKILNYCVSLDQNDDLAMKDCNKFVKNVAAYVGVTIGVTVQVAAKVVSRKSFKIFILDLAIS